MGNAMMGTGQASGEDRALRAAEDALQNPLLGEVSVRTAKGVLVNITGGSDMTLFEVDQAAQRITGAWASTLTLNLTLALTLKSQAGVYASVCQRPQASRQSEA